MRLHLHIVEPRLIGGGARSVGGVRLLLRLALRQIADLRALRIRHVGEARVFLDRDGRARELLRLERVHLCSGARLQAVAVDVEDGRIGGCCSRRDFIGALAGVFLHGVHEVDRALRTKEVRHVEVLFAGLETALLQLVGVLRREDADRLSSLRSVAAPVHREPGRLAFGRVHDVLPRPVRPLIEAARRRRARPRI